MLVAWLAGPPPARAEDCDFGKRSRSAVEKALAQAWSVESVQITKWSKTLDAYNPMSWIVDWDRDFRTVDLTVESQGKVHTFRNCSATYRRSVQDVTFRGCEGGAFAQGLWFRSSLGQGIADLSGTPKCEAPAPASPTTGAAVNDGWSKKDASQSSGGGVPPAPGPPAPVPAR